jgi:O-antigen/teichoic acid export membrane protein
VLIAAGVLVFAEPLASLIGLDDADAASSVRVLALTLPLATWGTITLAGTRAFGRMRTTVVIDKIGRPVAQLLLVLGVSLVASDLLAMTVAWAVPYVVAALVAGLAFRRFLHRRGTMQHTEPTKSYKLLRREYWRFTWPRSITRLAQMAIQRMDIVLVAALRSPQEAAIYTAATRFVALGQFATQAIQQVLQPKFTALIARDEHDALRDIYRISTAWSMAVAWPMYVGVASAPLVYLGLFGQEYADEGLVVVLLMAAAMMFAVATGPCDTLLLMSGRSALSLANALAALALDIVLCLVLIPEMGIEGAALAWAIAVSTRCLLAVVQVRVTMKVFSFGSAALVAALANVVSFAVPLLVAGLFVDLNVGTLLLVLGVCFPLYAACLWLGRRVLMLDVLRGLFTRASRGRRSSSEEALALEDFDDA